MKPSNLSPTTIPLPDPASLDPAAELSLQVDIEALRAAVEALPPEFREVIILRELEGLSYKEIAAATSVSIGTVMSRLARARKRLQSLVPHDAPTEADHGKTSAPKTSSMPILMRSLMPSIPPNSTRTFRTA